MKVNTDGVLLGALANAVEPHSILDIGTGTGVIALMLAQRFAGACVDAVEIDEPAALTARFNFEHSPFAGRMNSYALGFEEHLKMSCEKKYDLIVSNPPFFLNSLESPGVKKNLARHADHGFFQKLVGTIAQQLSDEGICAMVLPVSTSTVVKQLLSGNDLCLQQTISVRSFPDSELHREIITFGLSRKTESSSDFVIYSAPKIYSELYQSTLRDFLTIF